MSQSEILQTSASRLGVEDRSPVISESPESPRQPISPPAQSIPLEEVDFHPHSLSDPSGRVFRWQNQLYRGIKAECAPFFRELLQNGAISRLVERGLLIDTKPTPFTLAGYPLVVRHRLVPFVSYPQEWCPAMLKEAALTIVTLAIELARCGLTMRDAHPWNLLFDACRPVYVDLGSVMPINGFSTWPAYAEFCRFCLYPLMLMSQGDDRIARLLICEDKGVQKSELFRLAPYFALPAHTLGSARRLWPYLKNRLSIEAQRWLTGGPNSNLDAFRQPSSHRKLLLGSLEQLWQQVESIPLPSFDFQGGDRTDKAAQVAEVHGNGLAAEEAVKQILTQLRPDSVLSISSDTGWAAKQAALLGSQVVAFDADLGSVTRLYQEARRRDWPILPLVMDFTKPTPARGLGDHWTVGAADRFQCDMVLASGLLDGGSTWGRRIGFDQLVDGLSLFARRWLVLDFIPPEGIDHGHSELDRSSVHRLEDCIQALQSRFPKITTLPAFPGQRLFLVCEK